MAAKLAGLAPLAALLALAAVSASAQGPTVLAPGGSDLYQTKCGLCHRPAQVGTNELERRLGKGKSLLAERSDLDAAYIKAIVRTGLNSMPAITRVEVSDPQLDLIANYVCCKK